MENEKLENQKISENDLEKAAGGYTPVKSRLPDGSISLLSIKIDGKERYKLEEAGCLDHTREKDESEEYCEYIKREKLGKALKILNKKESFFFSFGDADCEYDLKIIF